MFSKFFIYRPIFAAVLSIVIVIIGLVGLLGLPIELFPNIVPPTVSVSANYPGANALDVAENVATPIEVQVNGVEDSIYMLSKSTNDGQMTLDVTFRPGTDLNMAQVLVQNRVSIAQAKLPEEVKRQGVSTKKKTPQILLLVNLTSEYKKDPKTGKVIVDPKTGKPELQHDLIRQSNFATLYIKDVLARIPGAGDVNVLGPREYSMRIWLDPDRLASLNLTASDVVQTLRNQNIQVPAGQIGQSPVTGVDIQYPINVRGKLSTVEEFGDLVIKTGDEGRLVKLKNLVKEDDGIELAAKNYDVDAYLDGKPSCPIAIYQLPGANALATAEDVRQRMKKLKSIFPEGMDYSIVYDTTIFVDESIAEVYDTLILAVLLVFLVVLVFLQDWRTTVIPMVAVPVSLIGTFAVMMALGFSLNNLSLFGLILAIGIVVDDAIVVVENTQRYLEKGFAPKEAVSKAMAEISGALVATTLVVCAVFVPTAFLAGISGAFYKQFALTIAGSTLISTFNALTMSPALCGLLLKAPSKDKKEETIEALPRIGWIGLVGFLAYYFFTDDIAWLAGMEEPSWQFKTSVFLGGAVLGGLLSDPINFVLAKFFGGFNQAFSWSEENYGFGLRAVLRVAVIALVVYGGLVLATAGAYQAVPSGFIPQQDKGYLLVNVQLPDGASKERTNAVIEQIQDICLKNQGKEGSVKGVEHVIGIPGYSLLTGSVISNAGGLFLILDSFDNRKGDPSLSADNIAKQLRQIFTKEILEAQVAVFGAPPVDGLGSTGGFKLQIKDMTNTGPPALQGAVANLAQKANAQPGLVGVFSSYSADQPQVIVKIDRDLAKTRNVPISEITSALGSFFGSSYINDFTFLGRNWQVMVQADPAARKRIDDISQVKVRNSEGQMVALEAFLDIQENTGPPLVNRYNMAYSADVNGSTMPGVSSGQAIALMSELAKEELPTNMTFEWTELSFQEIEAADDPLSPLIFPLAVLFVFLTLAAQYESWTLPLAIILIVPMALLFALLGVLLNGMDNNIFTQIGIVVLIGLSAKNAILIVEFAKQKQDDGLNRFEAAVQAAKLRLRPILMTAFSFILGVIPLVVATGAGAEMRVALGIAVFYGMLGVTVVGLFLTPVFYLSVRWITERNLQSAASGSDKAASTTEQEASQKQKSDGQDTMSIKKSADGKAVETGIQKALNPADRKPPPESSENQ